MIICFENISNDKKFDRIYICTKLEPEQAFREINKVELDDIIDPYGVQSSAVSDPFMLSYVYAN